MMKRFFYLIIIPSLVIVSSAKAYAASATLSLIPAAATKNVTETFDVQIYLNANGNSLRGADVSLNFNSQYLEVVDMDPNTEGIQVTPGTIFSNYWVAANTVDQTTGKILLSINTFNSFTGQGAFGTIRFKAKAAITNTPVNFNPAPYTKITAVGGADVAGALTGAAYTITGTNPPANLSLHPGMNKVHTLNPSSLQNYPISKCFAPQYNFNNFWQMITNPNIAPGLYFVKCLQNATWSLP